MIRRLISQRSNRILPRPLRRCSPFRVAEPERLEVRDCPAAFALTPVVGTVVEGEAAEFRVTMAAKSNIPQAIMVSTEAITATLGTDYMHRTERITFFPGEVEKTFRVQTLRDPIELTEGIETLRVIVAPVGGSPALLSSILTIDDYEPPELFEITFNFVGDVPQSVISASATAAQRWTEIIVGDVPDVVDPTFGVIDDILVTVQMGLIPDGSTDGDGNTLANARPTAWRNNGTGLPYLAEVGVDPADANRPDLVNVMIHEFAHALGFPGTDSFQSLIEGAFFVGDNAVREYRAIFGSAANPAGVPMEQSGGTSTAYGHWSEAVFGNELLTGFINPAGNPLSSITVGAFADIGYTVDYAAADPYSPPTGVAAGAATPGTAAGGSTQPVTTGPATRAVPTISIATITPHPQIGPLLEGISARHQLPVRITFPDQPSVILSDTEAAREVVRASLASESNTATIGLLNLRDLSADRKAMLAAWAAYGEPASAQSPSSFRALVASHATETSRPGSNRFSLGTA